MNPRDRQCRGKHKHPSKGKAEAHIRHLEKTKFVAPGTMRAYACGRCVYWHVGHKSRQQQQVEAV